MKLKFSNTPIGRLRLAGIIEGISFLLLLFVAMPLKYIGHIMEPVKIIGWIHGVLFIFYVVSLVGVKFALGWPLKRVIVAFIASLLPFGTFLLDPQLRKEEEMIVGQMNNKVE